MKFVSCRVRPGVVEVDRICVMRIGRPVRVARMRRVVKCRCPLNWRGCWRISSSAMVGGYCTDLLGRGQAQASELDWETLGCKYTDGIQNRTDCLRVVNVGLVYCVKELSQDIGFAMRRELF